MSRCGGATAPFTWPRTRAPGAIASAMPYLTHVLGAALANREARAPRSLPCGRARSDGRSARSKDALKSSLVLLAVHEPSRQGVRVPSNVVQSRPRGRVTRRRHGLQDHGTGLGAHVDRLRDERPRRLPCRAESAREPAFRYPADLAAKNVAPELIAKRTLQCINSTGSKESSRTEGLAAKPPRGATIPLSIA